MTAKKLCCLIVILLCQTIFAQQDSITVLREVLISDPQLERFTNSQQIRQLNDSVLRNNKPSLTTLLQFNSVIFFKENGFGSGVASPSFRGTTARQTAVIWNGINVNSIFNGQTDFNSVSTSDFSTIGIRSGGGSVIYGSSAIGGSIHLENEISFGNHFSSIIHSSYGSFNTLGINYKIDAGSENFAFRGSISHNSSENDYRFPNSARKNINGDYENTSLSITAGYKFNRSNFIKLYSQVYAAVRPFPLQTPSDTKTEYRNHDLKSLLEWTSSGNNFTSKVKLAFLSENYTYYENIENEFNYFGEAQTAIAKYDFMYRLGASMLLNAVVDYTHTNGRGSDVMTNKREIGSGALLFRHHVNPRFLYEASVRTEITANYESPLLFSAGISAAISEIYTVKINASRNFRIPTFNDMYWRNGGNPNLKPESSLQAEIGNIFQFGSAKVTLNGYYNKITDMIHWFPGTTGSWLPQNVDRVTSYGGEVFLEYHKAFGSQQLTLNGTYAYTISENEKTGKQLIYVPYHKATFGFVYGYQKFAISCQGLLTGEVFTRSDNNARYNLDAYTVTNFGVSYKFGKKIQFEPAFRVLNAFDTEYSTMERRPYPGRHYNTSLTIIF